MTQHSLRKHQYIIHGQIREIHKEREGKKSKILFGVSL